MHEMQPRHRPVEGQPEVSTKSIGLSKPREVAIDVSREQEFVQALKYPMWLMYQINQEHGWHDPVPTDAECVALVHSEASELLEGLRHGNPPSDHIPDFSSSEEEAADIIIRLMSWGQRKGWRLGEAVMAKARFNNQRAYKHGGKRF